MRAAFRIGKQRIEAGERRRLQLEVASLYDYTPLYLPVEVIHSRREGPALFVSAAIHGDELNGVEIIQRLLARPALSRLRGTLIAVPVVNIFGFNDKSRYLPDRRDLNRCFPGSPGGSLGSRLARLFMKEIVQRCSHGIDLHTGAVHRTNLPQVRASLDDPETEELAKVFGVPVVIHSRLRDGSLREAARKKGIRSLLFEGGEALRLDEGVIRAGLAGCLAVMRHIGMLPQLRSARTKAPPEAFVSRESFWVRAPHSGLFKLLKAAGDRVTKGEPLARITDAFGGQEKLVECPEDGIIIGHATIPPVNRGDAIVHIAGFRNLGRVKRAIDLMEELD